MATVLITVGFVALFFVLMSVRLIFLKNGEFKGTCASQSPFLNKEGVTCSLCGKTVDSDSSCANPDNEVDKVLAKFK
ncbi:hypothetical protein [Algoriphagus sanaruensis]|jgi:hypothetical protein|uniref:Membrane or secreted protein n=1 Tax=Algoriphagus sanaruensis TaxID=1727163 RepID=A0A142EKC0_9BACT|nr:hypothetical protein [Algoriphagus sanaruensis]AMQ55575.1 hypothetical protein AO498_04105 [Algoriphagus sanaruensis]